MDPVVWWGYMHVTGTYQVKRYFGDQRDIDDAEESLFCRHVVQPFYAYNIEEAAAYIKLITDQK